VTLVAMETLRARAAGSLPLTALLVAASLVARAPIARAQGAAGPGGGEGVPVESTADHPPPGPLPSVNWLTLETPHFRIHFYEDERALAYHTAVIAERAFRLNTRYLNWHPTAHTNLTLEDQTDFANGFASSVPYNYIFGFVAPPGGLDELNDFDDYLKLLITHEFTHVVHLDTILGFARIYNFLFGKLYAPNLSQPNWFVEGLAVLMETRQTTGGRLRSAIFDMELRVPFLEGRLFGLDNVSSGPLAFPQGTAAYLYGSSLLRYLEDRYGPLALREISHRYGRALIPGGINRVAAETVGRGYASTARGSLWEDWQRSQSHKYALETEEAARRGLTVERRLTHDAPGPRGDGFTPSFFADGTVLYHRINNDQSPAFVRLDRATGHGHVLAQVHGAGRVVATPDGRALVYSRESLLPLRWRIAGSSNLEWNDLFWLDLATGEERELTRARRAEEPAVSPDGKRIACTVGSPGARQLAVVPIEGGVPRVLGEGLPGFAYTPDWSPDGRLIVYSRWTPGGFRDIHLFEIATGTDRALMHDRALDVDPRFSPDGRSIVFSSDRTGIYNVFAYDLETGRIDQVTNLLSGAFQPAVSPDGRTLVYMGFTSDGYDLFETAYDPWTWLPAQPFMTTRPDAPADPASLAGSPDHVPGEAPVVPFAEKETPYEPWRYLYPHSWVVKLLTNPLGVGDSFELQFGVSDPVGNHVIGFDAVIPGNGNASVSLDYSYRLIWPAFDLSLSRTALLANDLIVDGARVDYVQNNLSGAAQVSLPVVRTPASSGDVAFGYAYRAFAPADPLPLADPTRGITIPPQTGPDASLFVAWSYSNAHAWPYSISLQEGRQLGLRLDISDPALGGRFRSTRLRWSWMEYATPPWARLHALALLYAGGIGVPEGEPFFGLGGFVQQDLLRALFLQQRQCCTYLRGYDPSTMVGDQFHLFSAEYRAPLLWLERGYSTFPVYLRRLHGAAFLDAGEAFYGSLKPENIRYGVGAELRFQMTLVYYIDAEIQVGVARGLSTGGSNHAYVVSSFPF
jgi:hypothetical protein